MLPDHLRGLGARRNSDSVEPTSRRGGGGAVPSNVDVPKLLDKLSEGLVRPGSSLSTAWALGLKMIWEAPKFCPKNDLKVA